MQAFNVLSEAFLETHPTEAAITLEGVEQKRLARFLSRLTPKAAAKVFEHIDPEIAAECLGRMTPRAAALIVEELGAHVRVAIFRLMASRRQDRLLAVLEEPTAEQMRRMLRFADASAAALMETDVLTLQEDMRTDEAMRRIRRSRLQFEGELYVLDRKHALVGVTTLHALLKARPDQPVSVKMSTDCVRILASTPQRDLLIHPLWVEHNSVAVIDDDNVFLGVVDHRTVAKAAEQLQSGNSSDGGLEAALALGELYWVGLSGMLDGLAGRALAKTKREDPDDGASVKS